MYQFFHHVLSPVFDHRLRLLTTDTDSFILEIQSDDLTGEQRQIRQYLDLSNYDNNHILYNSENRKVPGKSKNKYPNKTLTKFVGISSKCCALDSTDGRVSVLKRLLGVYKVPLSVRLHNVRVHNVEQPSVSHKEQPSVSHKDSRSW